MKTMIPFVILLSLASEVRAQTPAREPEPTLQSLLTEVHQLRLAIEGMTSVSQRIQIALYGMQMQDAAVARAAQRLDNARNKCSALEGNRQHFVDAIRSMEDGLATAAIPAAQEMDVKVRVAGMRHELESRTAEAQTCQAAESDAANQLRNEQAKLQELQDRIARLDKALEQLSSPAK